jgi:Ca-activated chloride channel family protein
MAAPYSGANRRDSITFRRPVLLAAAAGLAATTFLPVPATGQFSSGVSAVEVYASATGPDGQPVTNLTRDDFVLREDGQPQQVTTFFAGEFPLTAALAIDRSFSMAGSRLAVAKSAARVFLGELRPADESAIVAIGSEVEVVAPRSTDRAAQYAILTKLDAFGTTSLHDAIIEVLGAMEDAKGRRAVVLLSDGADRFSKASAADVLSRARRSDVLIYAVALGDARPPLFAELASLTGARSFHVRDPKQLSETLRSIAQELRHQYLLGYTPSKPITPGQETWRSIEVRVNRPDVRVRARDGYLAR